MKKQMISFLALFGLVFVLSVYYILLPTNLFIKANGNAGDSSINVNFSVDETANLYFAKLDSQLEEKHTNYIYERESLVASKEVENEVKETALNEIVHEQKLIHSESAIVTLIKELGYYNAYVEYQEDMIKVVVQAEELDNTKAAEIMSLVMDHAMNGLLVEIEYVK